MLLLFITLLSSLIYKQADAMMLRLENEELVNRSHLVLYGIVKDIRPRGEDAEAIVLTYYALKGKLPVDKEVRVIFSRGMEDSPQFEVNEQVLLFLTRSANEIFQTVGGTQGKFSFGILRK